MRSPDRSGYHIPLDTLRSWEQSGAEPDQLTPAYLNLIA
jgi:DNA-binding transcriptional regulator YiaG